MIRSGASARGSGTMLNVAVMLVLLVVAATVCGFGGYAVLRHRATNAADLAALAGAKAEGEGTSPCPVATRLARSNSADLLSCSVVGDSVDFVVTVSVSLGVPYRIPGLPGSVSAEANAGPVH